MVNREKRYRMVTEDSSTPTADILKLNSLEIRAIEKDPEWLIKLEFVKRLHLVLGDPRIPIISDLLRQAITLEELEQKLAELNQAE